MAGEEKEPTWSMGDDAPLAVLSNPVAPAFSVLPAALRPGHEPADRFAARAVGDGARCLHRSPRECADRESEKRRRSSTSRASCLMSTSSNRWRTLDRGGSESHQDFDPLSRQRWRWPASSRRSTRIIAEAPVRPNMARSILVLSDRGVDDEHAAVPMLLAVGAIHATDPAPDCA